MQARSQRMSDLPRISYSRDQLLTLQGPCACPSRSVRRRLAYFRILVRHIPVIESRPRVSQSSHSHQQRTQILVPVVSAHDFRRRRCRRRRPLAQHTPSLLLTNLRAISNKFDEVAVRISALKPDLVVFTESWLDENTPDSSLKLPSYNVQRKDRVQGKGGGILCYISDLYTCISIDSLSVPSLSNVASEFLCVFINELFLVLLVIYHPFWNDVKADELAISCILDVIDFSFIKFGPSCKFILCGDFNDLHKSYSQISHVSCLLPLVEFPTRKSNTLDQIFTNYRTGVRPSSLPPIGRSDHCCVYWKPSPQVHTPAIKRVVRKFTPSRFAKFSSKVANFDWSTVVNVNDLESAFSFFTSALFSLYDFCFPLRTIRLRSCDPEWMDFSLKILIDDRDRAYHNKNWSKFYRLRSEVVCRIRELKLKFVSRIASSRNPKKLWHALRSISRSSNPVRKPTIELSADDFSKEFSSNFQPASEPLSLSFLDDSSSSLQLNSAQVYQCLRKLKNKGCGPDGLPSWIFKKFSDIFSSVLTNLFNRCLSEGLVPSILKLANVTPIPKCEHPRSTSHFRPISILPVLSKILERLILQHFLLPALESNIKPDQFAYVPRPGSGTTSALVQLQHQILHHLDSPGAVRILSADFRKAFDKLPHSSVITACLQLNLDPRLIRFVSSFLANRMQRIAYNGDFSNWSPVSSGVPQGSVLGPILFCLVMNDLSFSCPNSQFIKYADDVLVLHFLKSQADDSLQVEWNSLVSWSNRVNLPLNYDKCCVLDFVTKKSIKLSPILTQNILSGSDSFVLSQVSSLCFLGVTFSNNFKWNTHFEKIIKKSSRRLFILRNLRRSHCPPHLMFQCYVAFIRSVLTYGYSSFCNAPDYLFQKLFRFERRAFRIMNLSSSDYPSLKDIMDQLGNRLFAKVSASPHHSLRPLFVPKLPTATRSNNDLMRPFCKTKRYKNSFIRFCTDK